MVDQYLNAIIKNDPAVAPLFIGFRQTENATVVKLGNGLWKTATALGKLQRRYADPVSGQAAYFGLIEESGVPTIVTLRLRVENKKVTEAEWVIAPRGPRPRPVNGSTSGGRCHIRRSVPNCATFSQ